MKAKVSIVLCVERNGGIGFKNRLPWGKLETDMKHFKTLTIGDKKNAVIMGRKTYLSIPEKYRPLRNRRNMILTRNTPKFKEENDCDNIDVFDSIDSCLLFIESNSEKFENVFVIGGGQIYNIFLSSKYVKFVEKIYVTKLEKSFQCDTFFKIEIIEFLGFNKDHDYESLTFEDDGIKGVVELWWNRSVNIEEYQYLDLCKDVIETGYFKTDRTKVGTFSKFGVTMRFDLSSGQIPLLTTKRVFIRGIIEELLWFLKGDTNASTLSKKNVKIWDGNGSRKFLDLCGFQEREEGDLGPVYGFQWRHFNAKYVNCNSDYSSQGIDQIKNCIELINNNPSSRRIIFSAWNPCQIKEMVLPPCHILCQFFVIKKHKDHEFPSLDCLMYQRSGDLGLGVPFNVASYSILACMIAQICGLRRGEFIHVLGDAHVYKNHVEQLQLQMERIPRKFPLLKMNQDVRDIDGFEYKDFSIIGYKPHKTIKMEMAL